MIEHNIKCAKTEIEKQKWIYDNCTKDDDKMVALQLLTQAKDRLKTLEEDKQIKVHQTTKRRLLNMKKGLK